MTTTQARCEPWTAGQGEVPAAPWERAHEGTDEPALSCSHCLPLYLFIFILAETM
jgi:hypothetical protein